MNKTWLPMLEALSDEDLGQLMHAVVAYQAGKEAQVDNPLLNAMWQMILQFMSDNDQAYEETCAKRKAAGEKGGEAKATKSKQNVANAKSATENVANVADKEKDKEKDKDNNKTPKGVQGEKLVDESNLPEGLKDAVKEWLVYKRERKDKLTESGIQQLISRAGNKAKAYGYSAVIEVIHLSMSQGWKGIVWDKIADPGNKVVTKFSNFDSRGYDFDQLEREASGNG